VDFLTDSRKILKCCGTHGGFEQRELLHLVDRGQAEGAVIPKTRRQPGDMEEDRAAQISSEYGVNEEGIDAVSLGIRPKPRDGEGLGLEQCHTRIGIPTPKQPAANLKRAIFEADLQPLQIEPQILKFGVRKW